VVFAVAELLVDVVVGRRYMAKRSCIHDDDDDDDDVQ